jgi:hypothetical protein
VLIDRGGVITREGHGAKHGTAEAFERVILASCSQLLIAMEKARAAIAWYRDEWADADGAQSEDDQRPSKCSLTAS